MLQMKKLRLGDTHVFCTSHFWMLSPLSCISAFLVAFDKRERERAGEAVGFPDEVVD